MRAAMERGDRANELRALGELAGEGFGGATGLIRDLHLSVAERAWGGRGRRSPGRVLHDGISRGVYAAVRGVGGTVARVAGTAAGTASAEARPISSARTTNLAVGVLNGTIGDRLEERRNDLRVEMALHHCGRALPRDPGGIAA